MVSIRPFAVRFGLATLLVSLAACDGCKEEPTQPPATNTATPSVDAGAEKEDTSGASLYEAKMMAQTSATSASVHVNDVSRSLALELEAVDAPPPKTKSARVAPPTYKGKLSKSQLNRVFNAHAGAMKNCYERVLKNTPGLEGKVRLELVIGSDGSVRSARARGISLRDGTVHDCMERQAKQMEFPTPDGGALAVNKTYSFSPEL